MSETDARPKPQNYDEHALESSRIAKLSVHRPRVNARGNWLFVRMETRAGHVGLGLSHSGDDAAVFGLVQQRIGAEADRAAADRTAELGARAPGRTRSGGPSAVRRLSRVPRSAVADGFRAVEVAPFDQLEWREFEPRAQRAAIDLGVERIAAVREAIGPSVALMVDCHGRFTRELAIDVARTLEPLQLFWLEDLLWADEDPDGLAAVGAAIRQPQAAGVRTLTLEGFFPIVARRLADTVMPDIKHCGLNEARRIAALAEAARLSVSPHNPAGPVATLVSAHLAATLTNFVHLEYAWGEVAFRSALLDPAERIVDGALEIPTGPGFGAQLNASLLADHAFDPRSV